MSRLFLRSVSLAAAVVVLSACGDDTITNFPTTPTPEPVSESFSGTITPNGAATHTFSGATAGSVTATLTAVGPAPTTIVGFSLGMWNGGSCTVVTANDSAVQTSVLYGNLSQAGQLCVRIYDVGRLTESASYEVTVVHP